MKFRIINAALFISILFFLNACKPEEFLVTGIEIDKFNPEYAVPLINTDLSIDDLVTSSVGSFVKIQNDKFISIVYRGALYSSTAGDAVTVPDQTFSQTIVLNSTDAFALSSGIPKNIVFQSNQSFALTGREIDSIIFKAGTLLGSIQSTIKTGGILKVTLEDAINLGTILAVEVPFSFNGTLPVNASASTLLAGYRWNMSKGTTPYNNVKIKFDLTINPTTEPVAAGEQIKMNVGFNAMKFSRFYGYVGMLNLLNVADTIDLSVFGNSTSGQFTLDDPRLKIITSNSFGVPVKAGFNKLAGYTWGQPPMEDIITGFPDPLPVPVPNYNQFGITLSDSAMIDKNNSNLTSVIKQKPKQLLYSTYINLNPDGKVQRNFIADNSQVKFTIDVEFPLYGTAKNFVFEEDNPVDLELPDIDLIENVLLRFTGNNGYPLDLATQVYLLDSTGLVFDSVFTERSYKFLESATVGTDGKVIQPVSKTTDIVFNSERSKRLVNLKTVRLRAELQTTSNGGTYPSVKLYSDYALGVKIGVMAKLKVDSGNLKL